MSKRQATMHNYLLNKRIAHDKVLSEAPVKLEGNKKNVCISPTLSDEFNTVTPPYSQEQKELHFKVSNNELACKDSCSNVYK